VLCVGAGFATDNLNKFMKVPGGAAVALEAKEGPNEVPKPEVAAARVEETLTELKKTASNDIDDLLS